MFITAIIASVASLAPIREYPPAPFSFPTIITAKPERSGLVMMPGNHKPDLALQVEANEYPVHPNVQQVRNAMNNSAALIEHVQNNSKCQPATDSASVTINDKVI